MNPDQRAASSASADQGRTPRFFALIPAAGSGSRFGADRPKQYLPLAGRTLIQHTVAALAAVPEIARVFVVLSPEDNEWDRIATPWRTAETARLTVLRCGGATRAESVGNGLAAIAAGSTEGDPATPDDWVLVHDAARPCLSPGSVAAMIATLADDPVGGLLAVPVADTLKRADAEGRAAATVSRDGLWQAQTPQMFRLGALREALAAAPGVTDEAGAMEALGHKPRLVRGELTNLKVTYTADLELAARILGRSDT